MAKFTCSTDILEDSVTSLAEEMFFYTKVSQDISISGIPSSKVLSEAKNSASNLVSNLKLISEFMSNFKKDVTTFENNAAGNRSGGMSSIGAGIQGLLSKISGSNSYGEGWQFEFGDEMNIQDASGGTFSAVSSFRMEQKFDKFINSFKNGAHSFIGNLSYLEYKVLDGFIDVGETVIKWGLSIDGYFFEKTGNEECAAIVQEWISKDWVNLSGNVEEELESFFGVEINPEIGIDDIFNTNTGISFKPVDTGATICTQLLEMSICGAAGVDPTKFFAVIGGLQQGAGTMTELANRDDFSFTSLKTLGAVGFNTAAGALENALEAKIFGNAGKKPVTSILENMGTTFGETWVEDGVNIIIYDHDSTYIDENGQKIKVSWDRDSDGNISVGDIVTTFKDKFKERDTLNNSVNAAVTSGFATISMNAYQHTTTYKKFAGNNNASLKDTNKEAFADLEEYIESIKKFENDLTKEFDSIKESNTKDLNDIETSLIESINDLEKQHEIVFGGLEKIYNKALDDLVKDPTNPQNIDQIKQAKTELTNYYKNLNNPTFDNYFKTVIETGYSDYIWDTRKELIKGKNIPADIIKKYLNVDIDSMSDEKLMEFYKGKDYDDLAKNLMTEEEVKKVAEITQYNIDAHLKNREDVAAITIAKVEKAAREGVYKEGITADKVIDLLRTKNAENMDVKDIYSQKTIDTWEEKVGIKGKKPTDKVKMYMIQMADGEPYFIASSSKVYDSESKSVGYAGEKGGIAFSFPESELKNFIEKGIIKPSAYSKDSSKTVYSVDTKKANSALGANYTGDLIVCELEVPVSDIKMSSANMKGAYMGEYLYTASTQGGAVEAIIPGQKYYKILTDYSNEGGKDYYLEVNDEYIEKMRILNEAKNNEGGTA